VTALRLGTVQLCRVSHDFSTRATGEISRRLLPLPSLALGKPPIWVFQLGLREGCFNARWPAPRGVVVIQMGRYLLPRAWSNCSQATKRAPELFAHVSTHNLASHLTKL
jgi:hypothetical protein